MIDCSKSELTDYALRRVISLRIVRHLCGQCEPDVRAFAELAFNPNLAPVTLDDTSDDEETQTGAFSCPARRLPETVEQVRDLLLRNSVACIVNGKQHLIFKVPGGYRDHSTCRRKLDCIADEVGK